MYTKFLVLIAIGFTATTGFAANYIIDGNLVSTDGNIVAQSGFVRGNSYVQSMGYLSVATYGTFGGALTATGLTVNGTTSLAGGAMSVAASSGGGNVKIGPSATNTSFASLVVGQFNKNTQKDGVTPVTAGNWQANDPLLVAGNGSSGSPNNAFAVYKDGTVLVSKRQGDIGMGVFGSAGDQ